MADPFLKRLEKGVILCDGAMGTLLYSRGVTFEHSFDEFNLSHPQIVQRVHQDYIKAGAEIIETNTFGGNRFRLATHGLEDKTKQINVKGAKLAREAREIEGEMVFVAGSMGPLGKPLAPIGRITLKEAFDSFRDQAEALLEGGVDLFIIETISDLKEMKEAILAVRSVSSLPIIAQMTFAEDGNTWMGNTPEEIAKELVQMEVEVIGANCSVGPQRMLDVILIMAKITNKKLSAQPNAGFPKLVDGRFIYLSSPEYFAEYAKKFVQAGVTVVGGCCGTTPEHIKAMAFAIKQISPANTVEKNFVSIEEKKAEEKIVIEKPVESSFASKLGKKFVISVELDPPRGTNPNKILKHAQTLSDKGIDAVNIADSPMARVRMSCISLASLIKEQIGLEVILHFTCRDRNLMGLQSDLIGAYALGVRNILAITGDPPRLGDYPFATAVYDVDSIGLVKIIKRLNNGTDWAGNSIGSPTSFFIGVGVNPTAADFDKEMERFFQKIEAGADFAFTQPLYDFKILEKFLKRVEDLSFPIILGLMPLHSFRQAEFLHNEVPGIVIPSEQRERMRKAGDKGTLEGVKMAQEFLKIAKGLFSGIYLVPSFGKVDCVLEVLESL